MVVFLMLLVSVVATYGVGSRLRLDPNVAGLLPKRGEASALRQYLRAFGGTDLALVLVEGEDPNLVSRAAERVAKGLAALPTVERAAASVALQSEKVDPTATWRYADQPMRERLERAVSPEGMRARLATTRAMVLAPGASSHTDRLVRDPLRLWSLLGESTTSGAGVRVDALGEFASSDGRAHLVLVKPKGQALRGEDARAFVSDAQTLLADHEARSAGVRFGLTGGHAIAAATEVMLTRDLMWSSALSLCLAPLAFLVAFRRVRAVVAVMPPLFLGGLWTAGLASLWPSGLSGIAVAFMSVVIGVGVDTGVHVYAALLDARRGGASAEVAAILARKRTIRPVLVAATTGAVAFAALGLSEIRALRQLGLLCASGELLTAFAILAMTPVIGARLEREEVQARSDSWWLAPVVWLTKTRRRAAAGLVLAMTPVAALAVGFGPTVADAIVAVRPSGLAPLDVQQRVYARFGGRPGQWVVLVSDHDRDEAMRRADRITARLRRMPHHVESLDSLTFWAPAEATQRSRLAARDALALPDRASHLEAALVHAGFDPKRFAPALQSFRKPHDGIVTIEDLQKSDVSIMVHRYLGGDGDRHVAVVYLHPQPGAEHARAVETAIRDVDPRARVTGYSRLDGSLRASLNADLPRVGMVAAFLVLLTLGVALRRPREIGLAVLVVAAELAAVLVAIRFLQIPLHVYDALVLPVLLGITVDEAMFLLYEARRTGGSIEETLRGEGPAVITTGLTTAAGFSGLMICDFDGLRHLGMVGALGSIMGLVMALVIVPAGLRLRLAGVEDWRGA